MVRVKIFSITIIMFIISGLLGPVGLVDGQAGAKAHPLLTQLAAEQPDERLAIIVQKHTQDTRLEALVARLGGVVTQDLHIINAFAAEMKAQDAVALSRDPGVRWVSLDAPMERSGKPDRSTTTPDGTTSTTHVNTFLETLNVYPVWNLGLQGQGITIAVIDSGVSVDSDFSLSGARNKSRLLKQIVFCTNSTSSNDVYGHGTHVAGLIAGNGSDSNGLYTGMAPQANLISLKIADGTGMAYESDVVNALQWVHNNQKNYNIRVVNLSLNSTVEMSYHLSPLDAAAEILWFNGIVVVASSGNKIGSTINTANSAPANDPFIITVGASNEQGTNSFSDDTYASFSAFGTTIDGFPKPDIVAPGKDIVSVLSKNSSWGISYPERLVGDWEYFRISGTSMAAPMVSGAVALMLQAQPNLTPDQIKYRLIHSTVRTLSVSQSTQSGTVNYTFPYLDVYAAVTGTTTQNANTGLTASQLLWTGSDPITWGSVAWNSVAWNSVAWNSVAWNSVAWNSVAWNSVAWND